MGCDIHLYIEYRDSTLKQFQSDPVQWSGFGGRLSVGRDYDLFTKLAGVRGGGPCVAAPRGLPTGLAWDTASESRLRVVPDDHDWVDHEGYASMTLAESWVKYGSEWVAHGENERFWVTHPDWHSHTWLTTQEFRQALEMERPVFLSRTEPVPPRYWAALVAAEELERRCGEARLVMWFDN